MGINHSARVLLACFALAIAQQATAQQSTAEFMSSDLVAAGASVTKLSDGFVLLRDQLSMQMEMFTSLTSEPVRHINGPSMES